jgi:hypothetical protein
MFLQSDPKGRVMSAKHQQDVITYYNKTESRWGYRIILDGTKHFGKYTKGSEHLSKAAAMR